MKVFNDLRSRGVLDILIAVTDGLSGMPQALEVVFPKTTLQTCIVHLIRNSLDYASWKDRKPLAAALRPIYAAASAEAAAAALDAFEAGEWGRKFPTVVGAWRRAWISIGPNREVIRANQKAIHRSTPKSLVPREAMSSASLTRPTASISKRSSPARAWKPGGPQSVHSRGSANEPRSAWRRLNVSTPETVRTFRTTNRCPRSG